jgi:5-hydroxyisourate hydrolase
MIERISTHMLDTSIGKPAAGVPVVLERIGVDGAPRKIGAGVTDVDGRVGQLNEAPVEPGEYRLVFATAEYFTTVHGAVFYPAIAIGVRLSAGRDHFHIPVLASTFSYSTYLGS